MTEGELKQRSTSNNMATTAIQSRWFDLDPSLEPGVDLDEGFVGSQSTADEVIEEYHTLKSSGNDSFDFWNAKMEMFSDIDLLQS